MSILEKTLKLAQELDNKGLRKEADILDRFAANLDETLYKKPLTDEEMDINESLMELDWMDAESFKEMFDHLFQMNNEEEGMHPIDAAREAVRTMNNMAKTIEDSSDPTPEERARAAEMFTDAPSE